MELFRSSRRRTPRGFARKPRLRLEILEDRTLLSGFAQSLARPGYVIYHPAGTAAPLGTAGPTGYTPTQVLHAYGFDQISLAGVAKADGSGTTIAIVDAFDDPNIANDLLQFDTKFSLPNPSFTKVNQTGGTTPPAADSGWASEIALDVEWAHAIAPGASILLVEATDNSFNNLLTAVSYAASQPGVVAVSMSWGGGEFSGENSYDSTFTTPSGHSGVTFVASSGDAGAPVGYPAISPNVLAVGGTTLTLNGGNYGSESAWSGSGGGISTFEAQPAYQNGVVTQTSTQRANPDVAYDSDPNTGFPVYDSYNNGTVTPWSQFGGTSDAAPQWSALIALADQGLAAAGKSALDGPSQTLPQIYKLPAADFHDITTGSSLGNPTEPAGPGYDLATGRGTPLANKVVADLVGNPAVTHFSLSAPSGSTAGAAFSVTVTALDQNNKTVAGYTGKVHFSSSDGAAGLPADFTFTTGDAGAHTFTNAVTLKTAGSQTVKVNDAAATSLTGSATVGVTAASPAHLAFGQQPANAVAGAAIAPAVTVQVQDLYNNLVATDQTDSVTVAFGTNAGNGTLGGTLSATVSNGVASFGNLSVNKTGTGYTLKATSGSLVAATSAAFNISPGAASQLSFGQQPTNTPAGSTLNPAVTVRVLDANGNLVTGDSSDAVTIGIGTNPAGGSLSGTLKVTASKGVVTFSDLAVSKQGTGYTLSATASGLASSTSAAFNVTAPGTHLVFLQQPTNVAAGANLNPTVTVEVLDAGNNLVSGDNSDKITLAIGANPGGGTLSGTTTVTVSGGIATFSKVSINKTGTGYTLKAASGALTGATSSLFNVTPGTADHLGFGQQPSNTVAGTAVSPTVTVQILDANNNLVTTDGSDSITVALGTNAGGGTLSGTLTLTVSGGVASFSTLAINKTGTGYTLKATSGSLASATSGSFNITPGKADHLAFAQQPSNTPPGGTLTPAVTVQVLDVNNNLVTTDSTDAVTLALTTNPTNATLSGGGAVTVSGGVATFSNLSVNLVGTGYVLGASSGTLKAATSAAFNVTAAATVIEDFENVSQEVYYASGLGNVNAVAAGYAAHDGSFGLDMWNSQDWIYRTDAGAQVKQGETLSVWVQFASFVDGRAYFGFGASANGTLSVVLAGNTNQFLIQDNSGFGFTTVAAVSQTYRANHWYRLEVAWGTSGSITARLYDSDGKTQLKSVQGTDTAITSGGIAFRATWDDKYFDTVTVTQTGSSHTLPVGDGGSPVPLPGLGTDSGADAARSAAPGRPAPADLMSLVNATLVTGSPTVGTPAVTRNATDPRVLFFTLPATSSTLVVVNSPLATANVPAVPGAPVPQPAPVRQESGAVDHEAPDALQDPDDERPAPTIAPAPQTPTPADEGGEGLEALLAAPPERLAADAYFANVERSALDPNEVLLPAEEGPALTAPTEGRSAAALAALLLGMALHGEYHTKEGTRHRTRR